MRADPSADLTPRDVPRGVLVELDPATLFSGDVITLENGLDYTCTGGTVKKHIQSLLEATVGRLVVIEDAPDAEGGLLLIQFQPGRWFELVPQSPRIRPIP